MREACGLWNDTLWPDTPCWSYAGANQRPRQLRPAQWMQKGIEPSLSRFTIMTSYFVCSAVNITTLTHRRVGADELTQRPPPRLCSSALLRYPRCLGINTGPCQPNHKAIVYIFEPVSSLGRSSECSLV